MFPRVKHLPEPLQPLATRRLDAMREGLNWFRPLGMYGRAALDGSGTFALGGVRYRYLWHPLMTTWRSERAVELPIAWRRVHRTDPANTLEVGNVLSQYFPVRHTVLDKYEVAPGVINEDVVDFEPNRKYDLIVSISTLEHVGWDEDEPRDPPKVLRAIDRLRDLLTDDGELLITFPHDWNTELDRFVSEGRVSFAERRCLKRVSADGRWVEVDCGELEGVAYGSPFNFANGITVGSIRPSGAAPSER
jgi:SAM-dependent methyltransferase